ncbi:MAG: ABC transporter substrate-binding protein [Porticoccaceae bacterium]
MALPRVGTYKKVNYELISELKPDLILAFGGNGMEMVNRLRALGFKVYMDEPQSLEDVALLLEDLGLLLGAEEQAKAAAADFRQRYQALQNQYQQQEAVQVFYQVWNQPLLTINGQHLISCDSTVRW